jgi:BirA family transcriptional regulator, biotin operon repressor / biotin---[acetyl-CoA-carboxylase] ligase
MIFFTNLPSTNTRAAFLLKNSSPAEGTVIYTNYQSAGRGQTGNSWESENGKNLLFSLILFPSVIKAADQFIISMTLSLGICDFLNRYIPVSKIKWPNDIYVKNDKIAGLLIENSVTGNHIESTIAGIGLNINQIKFISDAPNPVSLKMITGIDFNLTNSLNQLLSDLDIRYKEMLEGNNISLIEEYISKLYRLNEWRDYKDSNDLFTGRIISVAKNGRLQIETRSGNIKEYFHKEVDFIL